MFRSRPLTAAEQNLVKRLSGIIVLFRLRTVDTGIPREEIRLVAKDERSGFGYTVDLGTLKPDYSPDLTTMFPGGIPSRLNEYLSRINFSPFCRCAKYYQELGGFKGL